MGYTNKTTHYELPQYVATDKPKYLTDFNETMVAIDTQMYTNAQAAATADGKAVAAKDVADGAVASIGTLNAQINGDPQDPTDTGLAGQISDNTTDIEIIQALIGNGTPTTSDQTIIGAINGLEGAVAPREDGADLANNYATGEQFARGGYIFTALTDLTAGTAFASLTLNTDYKVSDTLVEQIAENTNKADEIDARVDTLVNYKVLVSITADGVKTFAELLSDLANAVIAKAETNSLRIMGLTIGGYYCNTVIASIAKGATAAHVRFFTNQSDASGHITTVAGYRHETAASCAYVSYACSTNTETDQKAVVPANGSVISVQGIEL